MQISVLTRILLVNLKKANVYWLYLKLIVDHHQPRITIRNNSQRMSVNMIRTTPIRTRLLMLMSTKCRQRTPITIPLGLGWNITLPSQLKIESIFSPSMPTLTHPTSVPLTCLFLTLHYLSQVLTEAWFRCTNHHNQPRHLRSSVLIRILNLAWACRKWLSWLSLYLP